MTIRTVPRLRRETSPADRYRPIRLTCSLGRSCRWSTTNAGHYELVFDEIQNPSERSPGVHFRSKTYARVVQELYGLSSGSSHHSSNHERWPKLRNSNRIDYPSWDDASAFCRGHLHEAPTCSLAQWYQRLTERSRPASPRPRRNRWYPRVIRRKIKHWDKKRPKHQNSPQPSKPSLRNQ